MPSNFLEFDDEKISEQIFIELGKTRQNLEEDINILGKWAEEQLHFPEKPSYRLLRCMVLFNKFSIEKAKQKLDMYYSIRTIIPEFFKCQPFSKEMALGRRIVYCVPLPKMSTDFKRVIYHQINPKYGPEYFNHTQLMESVCNLVEILIQEDRCCQFHYVFDCVGIKLGHLPKFSPMTVKKASVVAEKVFSNRVSSFYIVNFEPIMETILNTVIVPMLNAKLRSRIRVHAGTDILLKDFGKDIMPKDVGGNEKSLDELTDSLEKQYEKHRDRFDVLCTLKVDESLRPGKLINDDVLGYYGNFKKINVD